MEVRLVVHLEATGEVAAWWIESPDLTGFTAAADTLLEVRMLAESAARDLLANRVELEGLTFSYTLAEADEGWSSPLRERDHHEPGNAGAAAQVRVA